jgi:hypothetical protein
MLFEVLSTDARPPTNRPFFLRGPETTYFIVYTALPAAGHKLISPAETTQQWTYRSTGNARLCLPRCTRVTSAFKGVMRQYGTNQSGTNSRCRPCTGNRDYTFSCCLSVVDVCSLCLFPLFFFHPSETLQ